MKTKSKRILLLIIIAVAMTIITVSFLRSINPVLYIPIVFVVFFYRNKIKDFIDSINDNYISETLKKEDYKSVIVDEQTATNQEDIPNDATDNIQTDVNQKQNVFITLEEKEENVNESIGSHNSDANLDDNKKQSEEECEEHIKNDTEQKATTIYHKQKNAIYILPKPYEEYLDTSDPNSLSVNKTLATVKWERINEILQQNGISVQLLNTYIGPRYTRFEFKPDSSVRLSKIKNLSEDIRMQLAASETFIEAPIPGRPSVGIDIPNADQMNVRLINLINSVPSNIRNNKLLFLLGCDMVGQPVFCDLEKVIHLLIGGTTGSGKTMCLHSIVLSYLLRTRPDEVKLVLVDPSKIEFSSYNDIPNLLWPVIDDIVMANSLLRKLVIIAEDRYEVLSNAGVRSVKAYNEMVDQHNKNKQEDEDPMAKIPYIVVIIDQYAEILSRVGDELESTIQRLTQLARLCGIHLIISTQRPSADVITDVMKSCFPSRISFSLPSVIDSKMVLDLSGAEHLLGNGDMLYRPQGQTMPTRVQGVFVSDGEIRRISQYAKSQAKPEYEDSYFEVLQNTNRLANVIYGANTDSVDSLYDEVVEFVRTQGKASTSLLQRRFGIGYNRAARLIDTLEDNGVIGPANGEKPREVYLKYDDADDWLKRIFTKKF